jgi:hypothetical protein
VAAAAANQQQQHQWWWVMQQEQAVRYPEVLPAVPAVFGHNGIHAAEVAIRNCTTAGSS